MRPHNWTVLVSFDALLSKDDPPVFLIERAKSTSAFLLTCDHAGREIPHKLARLSLSEHELSTHVAWDLGVAALGRRLSARLDAFLILHNYSRLGSGVQVMLANKRSSTTC